MRAPAGSRREEEAEGPRLLPGGPEHAVAVAADSAGPNMPWTGRAWPGHRVRPDGPARGESQSQPTRSRYPIGSAVHWVDSINRRFVPGRARRLAGLMCGVYRQDEEATSSPCA